MKTTVDTLSNTDKKFLLIALSSEEHHLLRVAASLANLSMSKFVRKILQGKLAETRSLLPDLSNFTAE